MTLVAADSTSPQPQLCTIIPRSYKGGGQEQGKEILYSRTLSCLQPPKAVFLR